MPQLSWNDSYASGVLPWDTGQPEPLLVEFVTSGGVAPRRTLEVGSGTETNTIWLAERSFDMLGVDVSPLAFEKARAKIEGDPKLDFLDCLKARAESAELDEDSFWLHRFGSTFTNRCLLGGCRSADGAAVARAQ